MSLGEALDVGLELVAACRGALIIGDRLGEASGNRVGNVYEVRELVGAELRPIAEADEQLIEALSGGRPLVRQPVHLIGRGELAGISCSIGRRGLDRGERGTNLLELDECAGSVVQVTVGVGTQVGERGLGLFEFDEDPFAASAQFVCRGHLGARPQQFLTGGEQFGLQGEARRVVQGAGQSEFLGTHVEQVAHAAGVGVHAEHRWSCVRAVVEVVHLPIPHDDPTSASVAVDESTPGYLPSGGIGDGIDERASVTA